MIRRTAVALAVASCASPTTTAPPPPAVLPPDPPTTASSAPAVRAMPDASTCGSEADCRAVAIERWEEQSVLDGIDDAIEDFRRAYCLPRSRTDHRPACDRVDSVEMRIRRASTDALKDRRIAGRTYWAMYVAYCTSQPLEGAKCDELLYEAHRAFTAAGDRNDAERARRTLLDPKNGLADSPLAKKLR